MPLSKTEMSNVRKAYHNLSRLETEIAKAEACDIDCDEIRRRRDLALKRLKLFNEVYGNDHPENVS